MSQWRGSGEAIQVPASNACKSDLNAKADAQTTDQSPLRLESPSPKKSRDSKFVRLRTPWPRPSRSFGCWPRPLRAAGRRGSTQSLAHPPRIEDRPLQAQASRIRGSPAPAAPRLSWMRRCRKELLLRRVASDVGLRELQFL